MRIQLLLEINPIKIHVNHACNKKHNRIQIPQNWNGSERNGEKGLKIKANKGSEFE